MHGRRCIFLGGGPIDGFRWIENTAFSWECMEFNPLPFQWEKELDPDKPLDITRHQYHRTSERVFVHESEYTREPVYV